MILPPYLPYGAQVVADGVWFSLVCRHAQRLWIMLFDDAQADQPSREIELKPEEHRFGDLWRIFVPGARAGQFYLYRGDGDPKNRSVRYMRPERWFIDPYALAVAGPYPWGTTRGAPHESIQGKGASFPKGVIVANDFDWGDERRPGIPLAESVIYETHLRGFTVHPTANVEAAGTYLGFIDKIPYLKELGVTAVELLPIHEFNEMEFVGENTGRRAMRNYWGYNTLAFFAPMGRYARGGNTLNQVNEFKQLVRELHRAGIEVILDVVFNHTAESGDGGMIYSFRALDNEMFYLFEHDGRHHRNYSGCGNTVNCNHPLVRSFIRDCLRYWHLDMHVDGFRFDLAAILTRDQEGKILVNPPAVEEITEDPLLRGVKLIAEAWDAGGAYQVGSFPSGRWSEWNGRYRDDLRRFWRGDEGVLKPFMQRVMGSPDLYDRHGQKPQKSINFFCCHDGFTALDLVSYNAKHNEANGESNWDGENNNLSCNYGHEGHTEDGGINALRLRQVKNMFATLFLSQGVPMFLAGDEMGRTQKGNNNAYCQDNEISWLDWGLLEKNRGLWQFVRDLIALRKKHPVLCQEHFGHQASWLAPLGGEIDSNGAKAAALYYKTEHFLAIFNASGAPVIFSLPVGHHEKAWHLDITTQETQPELSLEAKKIKVDGRSVNVLSCL